MKKMRLPIGWMSKVTDELAPQRPSRPSGGIQQSVPAPPDTVVRRDRELEIKRDSPKSAIFNTLRVPPRVSSDLNRTFSGFRSRWTTPAVSWRNRIPSQNSRHFVLRSSHSSDRSLPPLPQSPRLPWSASSCKKIHTDSSGLRGCGAEKMSRLRWVRRAFVDSP